MRLISHHVFLGLWVVRLDQLWHVTLYSTAPLPPNWGSPWILSTQPLPAHAHMHLQMPHSLSEPTNTAQGLSYALPLPHCPAEDGDSLGKPAGAAGSSL